MVAAAAVGVPVPDILARVGGFALLTWLPGRTALDVVRAEPRRAYEIGGLLGRTQALLHEAIAPESAPPAARWHGVSVDDVPADNALLHLDWHGLNILVDGDRVSGVLDWANARVGSPWLDVARTHTMFTLDPAARDLATADQDGYAAVRAGWWDGYGATEADVPAAAYRWAGEAMLADLSSRYAAEPDRLDPLRSWLARL